jgi:putative SOS response-associated peptidase YedK
MPVILSIKDEEKWLDMNQTVEDLKAMLLPFPEKVMRAYPVDKAIGNVKNKGSELLDEIVL